MRSAPPFAVDFDAHAARPWVCALTCVSLCVGGLWAAQRAGWGAAPAAAVAAAAGLAAAMLAWRIVPPAASRLRWDGEAWHLGVTHDAGPGERQGELRAHVDAAGWMLLRFRTDGLPRATRWLALRRGDDPGRWHLLRCAVYSPRPAAGPGDADRRAHTNIPNDRP